MLRSRSFGGWPMESADRVFCDWLQVTVPEDTWLDVRARLAPVLDSVGCGVVRDEAGDTLWRAPAGADGTVKAKRIGAVRSIGTSGAVLAGLRLAGLFGEYLMRLGEEGHRVTRLDATLDRAERTPPVIERLVRASVSEEGVRLSRKRVDPRQVRRYVVRTPAGEDTGTIYLGAKHADVQARVYDKRQERLDRGLLDCGPLTRYELTLGKSTGVTLRDAFEPAAVFWHYAAPGLLERPEGVPEWVGHGSGFVLPPRDVPLPAARLVARVQASAEAAALVRLADECGPYGRALLFAELGRLVPAGDGDAPRFTRGGVAGAPMASGPPSDVPHSVTHH